MSAGNPTIFDALAVIDKYIMPKPTIVNEASSFVMVTYWWGRNVLNKNTMRPCPDERLDAIDVLNAQTPDQLLNRRTDLSHPRVQQYFAENFPSMQWRDPITYDAMIQNWEHSCRKAGCNYLAVEYPEYAKGLMYQVAINAKGYFIKKALEQCEPRGVVYIDGDMLVQTYPGVFDCPNIDFAARAWNYDARTSFLSLALNQMNATFLSRVFRNKGKALIRQFEKDLKVVLQEETTKHKKDQRFTNILRYMNSSIDSISKQIVLLNITGEEVEESSIENLMTLYRWKSNIKTINAFLVKVLQEIKKYQPAGSLCFDPYSFETSGGTMFFGNTPMAKNLLQKWVDFAKSPELTGKADDRVLSLLIMKFHLLAMINVIYLPIEYLWLTLNYNNLLLDSLESGVETIVFEHPECLTAEEAAANMGAAKNREPNNYEELVSDETNCKRTYKNRSSPNNNIAQYESLGRNKLYEQIYFANPQLGLTFQPFFRFLQKLQHRAIDFIPRQEGMGQFRDIVRLNEQMSREIRTNDPILDGLVYTSSIPNILRHLRNGQSVASVPSGTRLTGPYLEYFHNENNYELIAVNVADARSKQPEIEPEYRPVFLTSNPIVCKAGNTVLYDLLSMCRTLNDLTEQFNSGFMFLHRIRCAWVPRQLPSNSTRKRNNRTHSAANKNARSAANAHAMLNSA